VKDCGFRVKDLGVWRDFIITGNRSKTRGGRPAWWWRQWIGGKASGRGATRVVVEDSRWAASGEHGGRLSSRNWQWELQVMGGVWDRGIMSSMSLVETRSQRGFGLCKL
jgi:hypothetical protein